MTDAEQWNAICEKWKVEAAFRARMMDDAKSALLDAFGVEIADGVSIRVLAPTSAMELHLLMPPVASAADVQLSAINDGGVTIACASNAPGVTCWNTPNCPTENTCVGSPC